MTILLIAGSPSEPSRSAALLDAVAERLQFRHRAVERLNVRDLPPQALLLADTGHASIAAAAMTWAWTWPLSSPEPRATIRSPLSPSRIGVQGSPCTSDLNRSARSPPRQWHERPGSWNSRPRS